MIISVFKIITNDIQLTRELIFRFLVASLVKSGSEKREKPAKITPSPARHNILTESSPPDNYTPTFCGECPNSDPMKLFT